MVIKKLFGFICERQIPVLIPYEELSLVPMLDLISRYHDIPFIYSNLPWRGETEKRNLFPVMEQCSNLFIDTIPSPHRGIEEVVRHFGSGRMVFSSLYPFREPGAAISYLMYSEISEDDLENIAYKNLARLFNRIVL